MGERAWRFLAQGDRGNWLREWSDIERAACDVPLAPGDALFFREDIWHRTQDLQFDRHSLILDVLRFPLDTSARKGCPPARLPLAASEEAKTITEAAAAAAAAASTSGSRLPERVSSAAKSVAKTAARAVHSASATILGWFTAAVDNDEL